MLSNSSRLVQWLPNNAPICADASGRKNVANMVQSGVEFEELDASAFDEGACLIPACGTPRMAFLRVNRNTQYF